MGENKYAYLWSCIFFFSCGFASIHLFTKYFTMKALIFSASFLTHTLQIVELLTHGNRLLRVTRDNYMLFHNTN